MVAGEVDPRLGYQGRPPRDESFSSSPALVDI